MKISSALLLAAAATLVTGYAVSRLGEEPDPVSAVALCPGCNVVLVSLDTLRADHLGAYGYDKPTSPHIDALAAESVIFESAISQSAWTRPAHISMLTGLYPSEHGVVTIAHQQVFPHEAKSIAEVFSENGYATAAFTGGGNMSEEFGFARGFEVYSSKGKRIWDNIEDIREWLGREDGKFFLLVHGFEPHRPYKSDSVDRRALGLPEEKPRGWSKACKQGVRPDDMEPYVAEYDAAIRKGDRAVGELMSALSDAGVLDQTVVLFTSDHGEAFFEHGRCFHIDTLYREIVHVPYLVRVPGLPPRRVRGVVAASVSVARTLLDIVGLSDDAVAGPSLAADLQSETAGEGFVVSETATRSSLRKVGRIRSITTERDKLIEWPDLGRSAYFDLLQDPGEQVPTSSMWREWLLRRRLAAWEAERRETLESARLHRVPKHLKRKLRAMGYVGG